VHAHQLLNVVVDHAREDVTFGRAVRPTADPSLLDIEPPAASHAMADTFELSQR